MIVPELENTIPAFTSADERDARFAEWVAEGNTMRDGLWIYMAGEGDQVFMSGEWRPR